MCGIYCVAHVQKLHDISTIPVISRTLKNKIRGIPHSQSNVCQIPVGDILMNTFDLKTCIT